MPWRGPEYPGDVPTLGYQVIDWIERNCRIPDGDRAGEPFLLTDEMQDFVLHHYRLRPEARPGDRVTAFHYRRSQLVRPQKWGKGPFSAALVCAESVGPALFDGWDAAGEPVGREWPTPLVQITANSEDQTANVYAALRPMIELGPLADVIRDTGETRINLPGGGRIDPVTSRARSRLGQRVTFVVQDETGLWTQQNGMVQLAETQRRGLAGMGGRAVETTNAWDPSENSVAQRTSESRASDVHRDHRGAPASLSFTNKAERRRVLRAVYGDSVRRHAAEGVVAGWVDLDAIEAECAEILERDPAQAERFFGNRVVAGSDAFFDEPGVWDALAEPQDVPRRAKVVLGFDGSQYDDWTAIRARRIDGGKWHGFTPTFADGRPAYWNPVEHGGEVPRGEVEACVAELFDRFEVQRMYCDPELWQSEIDAWAARYGDKRVVVWPTYRTRQMASALERLRTDALGGSFTHDGCEVAALHARNARRVRRPGGMVVGKPSDHQKIDVFVADALAHEAAGDAVKAGQGRRHSVAWA